MNKDAEKKGWGYETVLAVPPSAEAMEFNWRKIAEYSEKVGRGLNADEFELFRVKPKPYPVFFDKKTQRAYVKR
jgi:hypothetical protein